MPSDVARTRQDEIFEGPEGVELLKDLIEIRLRKPFHNYLQLQSLVNSLKRLANQPGELHAAFTSLIGLARPLTYNARRRVAPIDKMRSCLDDSMLSIAEGHWRGTYPQWDVTSYLSQLKAVDLTAVPKTRTFLRKCLRQRVAHILTAKVAAPRLPAELALMVLEYLL